MPTPQIATKLRRLCHLLERKDVPDAQLLERFVRDRDDAAFELLAWRHGPMAFGVCQRLLRDRSEAEDAFQATLLILARKAGSIGKHASVGAWLYKVAYRVALRARSTSLRRKQREQSGQILPALAESRQGSDLALRELRLVLDDELGRLPEKYRGPVVLCYLEGHSHADAARQLSCPTGTVKTRLAHARRVLAQRLIRRGLTLGAGLLTADAIARASFAAMPPMLLRTSLRTATLVAAGTLSAAAVAPGHVANLTEGALRTMTFLKVKAALAIVTTGMVIAAAGAVSYRAWAGEPAIDDPRAPAAQAISTSDELVQRLKQQIAKREAELRRAEKVQQELTTLKEQLREAEERTTLQPPQGPVAMIFDTEPVTRDELADYLISRLTTKELETYLHHRVLESACRRKGIVVTPAEVEAAYRKERQAIKLTDEELQTLLLSKHQKTIPEWKHDILRPRLLLEKYSRSQFAVGEEEIRQAFESRYGERALCELIVWPPTARSKALACNTEIRNKRRTFDEVASNAAAFGATALVSQPRTIGRNSFGLFNLANAALTLQPGEISDLIDTPQGQVLLKCVQRLPAEKFVRYEDVRANIEQELRNALHVQNGDTTMKKLKEEAHLKVLWKLAF